MSWWKWFLEITQAASLRVWFTTKGWVFPNVSSSRFFWCDNYSGLWIHLLRRNEYHACDCHVGTTNIIVIPVITSAIPEGKWRKSDWMGKKHMETFLSTADTCHWLPDFPDLAFKLCRLKVDEISGCKKVDTRSSWSLTNFCKSLGKVSTSSCPQNCGTPNLLSHSDDLVGTLQIIYSADNLIYRQSSTTDNPTFVWRVQEGPCCEYPLSLPGNLKLLCCLSGYVSSELFQIL